MGNNPKGTRIHLSPAKLRLLRIYEIDRHVRTGAHPNASDLATVLEVHPRTVQRDIEFMRLKLGAPIEYDPLRRGWRYTEPSFSLTSLELPDAEREALESARRYLARLVASSIGEDVESLFEKLSHPTEQRDGHRDTDLTFLEPSLASATTELPNAEVSLLFRGAAASIVAGHGWRGDQKLELLSNGNVRLHMTVPLTATLERWVLGWADEVLVEGPQQLAAVIVGRQRRALRRQSQARGPSIADLDGSTKAQVALNFESEATPPPDGTALPKPHRQPEEPLQSDFGFRGRKTRKKRRRK